MGRAHRPTERRNREMHAAVESGETVEELAIKYGLKVGTVVQALSNERHKLSVSPEPLYRQMRAEEQPPGEQPGSQNQ